MEDISKKDDPSRELRETQQEIMIDLKIKTDEFLKRLKAHTAKNRVQM